MNKDLPLLLGEQEAKPAPPGWLQCLRTVNRELSIMRTAFHNARKRTPPKVNVVPYFPMVKETTIRKGFLTDAQYSTLRDEPSEGTQIPICMRLHNRYPQTRAA
jgi:hypothetical protein